MAHTTRTVRRLIRLAAVVSCLLASFHSVALRAQAANAAGTVWDGVYTEAQASRATATFNQSCANCHTLASQGNRSLSGDKFWEGFTQKTVGDLLTYVKTNMPNGNGGSLSASTYNDLVALILKSNNFPAGDGCNTCSCTDGLLACTKKACPAARPCGGLGGFICSATEYCAYVAGQACGASDANATCQPRPGGCTENIDLVCGCDGKTYANACAAAMAGFGYGSKGACPQ